MPSVWHAHLPPTQRCYGREQQYGQDDFGVHARPLRQGGGATAVIAASAAGETLADVS
jgi:hypothetical protein